MPVPPVMLRHLCFVVREAMKDVESPKPGYTALAVQALQDAVQALQPAQAKRMSLELTWLKSQTLGAAQVLLAQPRRYGTLTLTEIRTPTVTQENAFGPGSYQQIGSRLVSWERLMSE